MRIKFSYILLLFLCLAFTATAQRKSKKKKRKPATTQQRSATKDTAIRGATIEIIQSYTPEVKNTPKPEFTPALPPVDNRRPVFSYDVPKQSLYYTYGSLPIRPLALGKEMKTTPFQNYIKAGGGNLSTLYLDAGIGSLKGDNYETAFHLKHLSQAGELYDQKTSLTGFDATGTLHTYRHALHAGLNVAQNQYHYYGYNHEIYNYSIDSLKQAFTSVRLGIDLANTEENNSRINYHPAVIASVYNDKFDASEASFNLDVPASYKVNDELDMSLGINSAITQLNVKNQSIDNNIFKLTPAVSYHKDEFTAHIGLYPAVGKNGNYLLPDIEGRYHIKNSQYTITAGWLSLLKQNTYEQLSTRNPYMYNTYLVQQTKNNELFGGIRGNVGTHVSFMGRVSWRQCIDMPLFINDTSTADKKQFLVVYDKVSSLSLQASARYQVANTFSVGLSAIFTGYNVSTFRHAWHEPGVNMKADLLITPIKKLTVTAYLSYIDGIYAVDNNNISVKLKPILDLGGAAEYSFIPRLSVFLQVNNLLNNKYQRWYGYTAYGLNVYGGVRLKF